MRVILVHFKLNREEGIFGKIEVKRIYVKLGINFLDRIRVEYYAWNVIPYECRIVIKF